MSEPLPCPFCGSNNVSAHEVEGHFRWWQACCDDCGACAGDVRRQTSGEGTNEDWDRQAGIDAVEEWNKRA